jgi:4-hydroxybenzoate polyprenyltransferase
MLHFFKLIRFPNLVIIALTMIGVRYGLLEPLWRSVIKDMLERGYLVRGIGLQMTGINFSLLVISTVFIAAAGYIINDYFDTKTDRINKPNKVFVGRTIQRRAAIILHISLSFIGLLIAVYLAYYAGNIKLALIQVFSIAALWFYSIQLKKQLLAGNILIAILAALVPITTGIYEFASGSLINLQILNNAVPEMGSFILKKGAFMVIGYASFAFLSNLFREIIKDIEDIEGDLEDGCRTLPIVIGVEPSKFIAMSLVIFTSIFLGLVQQFIWKWNLIILFYFTLIAVQGPLIYILYILWNSYDKFSYGRASLVCKIIISTGVISMFIFRFIQ